MTISPGFEILFTTGITLLLVPSLTMILENLRNLRGKETESQHDGTLKARYTPEQFNKMKCAVCHADALHRTCHLNNRIPRTFS